MGLRDQYSVSVAVSRLVVSGAKETFTSLTTITGHLQPASAETTALSDGDYSKSFTLYTDVDANINIGDKVVIDGLTYYCKGMKTFSIGTLTHKEFIIELKNA